MLSVSVNPPKSVTEAVIVWVPIDRPEEKEPPEPITPSILEVQTRLPVRSPSSASLAVPEKFTVSVEVYVLPFPGDLTLTVGGVFDPPTVTVTLSEPVRPLESVTEAVIVCTPTDKPEEKELPEPISPSRLEVQTKFPVRSPSSASLAVPEKFTVSVEVYVLPSMEEAIVTVGGVLDVVIVTVMLSDPVRPLESVTVAVIVCTPMDKPEEKEPPEPISPSRLEVQTRLPVRSPSSASLAVPENSMVSAEG